MKKYNVFAKRDSTQTILTWTFSEKPNFEHRLIFKNRERLMYTQYRIIGDDMMIYREYEGDIGKIEDAFMKFNVSELMSICQSWSAEVSKICKEKGYSRSYSENYDGVQYIVAYMSEEN